MSIKVSPKSVIISDLQSRDEIPKVLIGLQELYCHRSLRKKVFEALKDLIPDNVNQNKGRRGMNLWTILVLGVLRLVCNWDYDKLTEIADNHITLRLMLGHSLFGKASCYALLTVKDNLRLFTPAILDKINQMVVNHGHEVIGNACELSGRCDSFVVETDVHFPTDINVLLDALRKIIGSSRISGKNGKADHFFNNKVDYSWYRSMEKTLQKGGIFPCSNYRFFLLKMPPGR
jgi:hypothetical protein